MSNDAIFVFSFTAFIYFLTFYFQTDFFISCYTVFLFSFTLLFCFQLYRLFILFLLRFYFHS